MNSKPGAGVAMVLVAAALWGTTGTAQFLAGGQLSSLWFGALRLLVAAMFFAVCAWAAARGKSQQGANAGLSLPATLGAGACMAIYNLAFFAGIRDTGVAVGTAVALGSSPVWAGLLQGALARQVPARGWWAGAALAIGGGALMTLPGAGPSASTGWLGIGLCLLSGLSYAGYSMFSQQLVRHAPAATVTLRSFAVAAALALPVAWFDAPAPALRRADLWAVAYVGVVTAGVPYLLFSQALRHISVATGVTLALGEPVVAFVLAVLVVGEQPSAWAAAGLAMVVIGVLAVVRAELNSHRDPGSERRRSADLASVQRRRSAPSAATGG